MLFAIVCLYNQPVKGKAISKQLANVRFGEDIEKKFLCLPSVL